MPLYEITLTASRVVKVHGASLDEASQRALAANDVLDDVEATDGSEIDDATHYDALPGYIRDIIDQAEAGETLEVLGVGQSANRVYDDGEYAVFVERVGPADGYDGPPVVVQVYDGNRWVDFDPELHGENDD